MKPGISLDNTIIHRIQTVADNTTDRFASVDGCDALERTGIYDTIAAAGCLSGSRTRRQSHRVLQRETAALITDLTEWHRLEGQNGIQGIH